MSGDYALTDEGRAVLAAGIAWLYVQHQPDDAVLQHHGVTRAAGDRLFSFIPGNDVGEPVVVVAVTKPVYVTRGADQVLTNPLGGAAELAAVTEALTALQVTVTRTWNGQGESGSFALAQPASASLRAAVDRYRAGCPQHHSVFCGHPPEWAGGMNCPWYTDGVARLTMPDWPALNGGVAA